MFYLGILLELLNVLINSESQIENSIFLSELTETIRSFVATIDNEKKLNLFLNLKKISEVKSGIFYGLLKKQVENGLLTNDKLNKLSNTIKNEISNLTEESFWNWIFNNINQQIN